MTFPPVPWQTTFRLEAFLSTRTGCAINLKLYIRLAPCNGIPRIYRDLNIHHVRARV